MQESKAGLAVGKLRSHASKQVSELAKEIVKKWKTEVEREKAAAGGGTKAAKPPGTSWLISLLQPLPNATAFQPRKRLPALLLLLRPQHPSRPPSPALVGR